MRQTGPPAPLSAASPPQTLAGAYGRPTTLDRPEQAGAGNRWNAETGSAPRGALGDSLPPRSQHDYQSRSPERIRQNPPFLETPPYRHSRPVEEGQALHGGGHEPLRRTSLGGGGYPNHGRQIAPYHSAGDANPPRDYRPHSASYEGRMPPNVGSQPPTPSSGDMHHLRQRLALEAAGERLAYVADGRMVEDNRAPLVPVNGHSNHGSGNTYPFNVQSRATPSEVQRFKVEDRNIMAPHPESNSIARGRDGFPLSRDSSGSGVHGPLPDHRQALTLALERGDQRGRGSPGLISARHPFSAASLGDMNGAPGEESSPHPKVISLVNEGKRGRVSPLPQAVQGAQAKARGPASEPGIKNEFARMFSGIGSGVGSAMSTPAPPDVQPPGSFPSSPIRPEHAGRQTPLGAKAERTNSAKPQRGGRRARKVKDADVKKEGEGENRGTGLAGAGIGRGQKRSRQNAAAQPLALAQP